MANISQYATGNMLHYIMGSITAPTRPPACAIGLSLGAPTSRSQVRRSPTPPATRRGRPGCGRRRRPHPRARPSCPTPRR